MQVYLDNSATTRPFPQAIDAMVDTMAHGFFNPSALYRPALDAQKQMDACRDAIAKELSIEKKGVIFTSGGTEANFLGIIGHLKTLREKNKVLYLSTEHPAVYEAMNSAKELGFEPTEIPVKPDGVIDLKSFERLLDGDVSLICVMHVNNETGAVQPLSLVSALRDKLAPNAALHVDGVQGFMRLPINLKATGINSYALSAHKIHGPKGIGALAVLNNYRLKGIMQGGGQEQALRSGTENTPGIAGLHAAIQCFKAFSHNEAANMFSLKALLYDTLKKDISNIVRNGPEGGAPENSPHILNVSLPPVRGETMVHALEAQGIYVSTGAACSSRKQQVSRTLSAMGIPKDIAQCAIRISLSPITTKKEIEYTAESIIENYAMLSKYNKR